MQKNPDASVFRNKPLEYPDEMRSLFDGLMATGKYAWGPSKEGLPTDGFGSSPIDLDNEYEGSAPFANDKASSSQSKPEKVKEGKRVRRQKSDDMDDRLFAVIKTLEESDGPSLDECNKILDEMTSLEMIDPLYIAAMSIFCEGKAYKEQWVRISAKGEEIQKNWIAMNAKRLGLL